MYFNYVFQLLVFQLLYNTGPKCLVSNPGGWINDKSTTLTELSWLSSSKIQYAVIYRRSWKRSYLYKVAGPVSRRRCVWIIRSLDASRWSRVQLYRYTASRLSVCQVFVQFPITSTKLTTSCVMCTLPIQVSSDCPSSAIDLHCRCCRTCNSLPNIVFRGRLNTSFFRRSC